MPVDRTIGYGRKILEDLGVVHFPTHSRYRVYPQDVTQLQRLTAQAVANTFGNWAEVIPINTIPFPFHIIGFCICQVSAVGAYHIQLGYNTINADPGANMEMGERRVRFGSTPISKETEMLVIQGQGVPENSRIMGRVKTDSGNADTVDIHAILTRHLDVSREVTLYGAFPW